MTQANTTMTQSIIRDNEKLGARIDCPLPVVLAKGEGVWVEDVEGKRYMDMLSAYSALSMGHRHPRIIGALKAQADKITLTSRAFYNENLGKFFRKLTAFTNKDMILPMNAGAEAVETAVKAMRRWAYFEKGVPENQAEIIVCAGNFHGRTTTVISFSAEAEYKRGFGPLTPGFKIIPYGDLEALKQAITPHTAGFLLEPIQGEGGIIIPREGYLREAYDVCRENNVLFAADEIQTGLGRTGRKFACDWEGVEPDLYIMGKALGGGVFPVSAVAANEHIFKVWNVGSHGSTFGGNPLGCAIALEALAVLEEENLIENAAKMGEYLLNELKKIDNPHIRDVRGRGLLVGVELDEDARPYCEKLKEVGLLCKETHDTIIRFAPPLTITKEDIDWALERVRQVL
ncbi:ornithine--oxo-acid transaminase [Numidum massiliense]|uniref:ornithine--oxo-acid transaminase n=1 Tax=Numidum massiliense TaxID=1522315 RepID=UPI0006D565A9